MTLTPILNHFGLKAFRVTLPSHIPIKVGPINKIDNGSFSCISNPFKAIPVQRAIKPVDNKNQQEKQILLFLIVKRRLIEQTEKQKNLICCREYQK